MIKYDMPRNWIKFDRDSRDLTSAYAEAKAAILSLQTVPYQRRWVDALQDVELKREVAGTSRIEGAEFTEQELDLAFQETPDQLLTRSQRQAHAVVQTYRWLAALPQDRPITADLISHIHRTIVTGADDDHCPPGQLRKDNQNVNFGMPRHRGAEGGAECASAFRQFTEATQREYQDQDPLFQALAAHYHLAAMHPYLDGNGRTARALEALLLQRAGLRDTCFIAMSNYYYDEKNAYLAALAEVRQSGHDLTPFLIFGLKGIALQSKRVLTEIQRHISKVLYRDLMYELFGRLKSKRKRVIAQRQLKILEILLNVDSMVLNVDSMGLDRLIQVTEGAYSTLKDPVGGLVRDLLNLAELNAIAIKKIGEGRYEIAIDPEWPTRLTETDFFAKMKQYPKAKTLSFPR